MRIVDGLDAVRVQASELPVAPGENTEHLQRMHRLRRGRARHGEEAVEDRQRAGDVSLLDVIVEHVRPDRAGVVEIGRDVIEFEAMAGTERGLPQVHEPGEPARVIAKMFHDRARRVGLHRETGAVEFALEHVGDLLGTRAPDVRTLQRVGQGLHHAAAGASHEDEVGAREQIGEHCDDRTARIGGERLIVPDHHDALGGHERRTLRRVDDGAHDGGGAGHILGGRVVIVLRRLPRDRVLLDAQGAIVITDDGDEQLRDFAVTEQRIAALHEIDAAHGPEPYRRSAATLWCRR